MSYDISPLDFVRVLALNQTRVPGTCPERDVAYRTSDDLPAVVEHDFIRRSYCILATVREDRNNSVSLLKFYQIIGSSTALVGNFSIIKGIVSHSLRGETATFSGNYSSTGFQRITVCINSQSSEALLYVDCESTPKERVNFVQRASGVLANTLIVGGIGTSFEVQQIIEVHQFVLYNNYREILKYLL